MLAQLTDKDAGHKRCVVIGEELVRALSFIHERGFHHHDVSSKKMLFNVATNKAFLIDFGLAARKDDSLKGFREATLYAHSFIFGKYPGKPWKHGCSFEGWEMSLEADRSI